MVGFSKRGLFGAPMAQTGTPWNPDPRAAPGAGPVQQDATVPTYAKPSTGQFIAGTIGDALQNWSGGQGTFLQGLQRQREYEQQNAQYQRQRADQYSDWERKQAYEAAHPQAQADDVFTRTLRGAGIDPNSAEGRAKYQEKVTRDLAPAPVWISDGAGGGRFVTPTQSMAPAAPVGKLTPLGGGATPQGARTFPVR